MKIKSFGDVLHNGYKVLVVKGSLLEIDLKTAPPESDFRKIYDKLVRYSNWEPIKSSAHKKTPYVIFTRLPAIPRPL